MRRVILLFLLLTGFTLLIGQVITINGQVTGITTSGETVVLPDAGIEISNVTPGTQTDDDGFYSITFDWNWNGPITIICFKSGYLSESMTFFPENNVVTINFNLESEVITNTIFGNVSTEENGGIIMPVMGAIITIQTALEEVTTDAGGDYSISFNWNWDSAVVVQCTAEGFHPQTYSFFPEESVSEVNFMLIPEEQPQPIIIEGFIRRAFPDNNQPVSGAFIVMGDGVNPPLCELRSSNTGYFHGSLVWNWYGPVHITCHYPGFNTVEMDYYPQQTINTLNFFMQLLPPIFFPPENLTGDIFQNTVSMIWDVPQSWPLEDPPLYRVYFKGENDLYFLPIAEVQNESFNYSFSLNQSGQWSGDFAITAFLNNTETAMSNVLHQEISVSTKENEIESIPFSVGVFPNPFNPSANISFNLKKNDHVSAIIYNIRGQEVATIIDDVLPIGDTKLIWHGLDNSGKSVGSGTYLLRIVTQSGEQKTLKMALIK